MIYFIAFGFGVMFGISLRIKSDFKDAYTQGYKDGHKNAFESINYILDDYTEREENE